jgi:uncharacterized membrane protein HdeD (DUF308 family)
VKDFVKRLSSRKFLLTILGIFLITVLPEYTDQIITLTGIFVGSEGIADIVSRYASSKVDSAKVEKDIALINQGEIPAGEGHGGIVPGATE